MCKYKKVKCAMDKKAIKLNLKDSLMLKLEVER